MAAIKINEIIVEIKVFVKSSTEMTSRIVVHTHSWKLSSSRSFTALRFTLLLFVLLLDASADLNE